MCCTLKWIAGQKDFKVVWFDFFVYGNQSGTEKNQNKLIWNQFDVKFILNYNICNFSEATYRNKEVQN